MTTKRKTIKDVEGGFLDEGDTDFGLSDILDDEAGDEGEEDLEGMEDLAEDDDEGEDDAASDVGGPGLAAPAEDLADEAMRLMADIPIQLVAVLGKKSITMQDLLQLQVGEALELGKPVSTVVDLVANGKLFAKGELVEIDGKLGVKIIQVVK